MTTTQERKTKGVIPYLPEEIDAFEGAVKRFQDGTFPELEFVGFRLKQGVYGQRQINAQMVRVKIPFGGLTADQLDALGVIADRFAPLKKGHLTTRENVQYHHADYDEVLGTAEEKPAQPMQRATEKVGRNDPCPCGSGKKYKHCHGKLA